ncbi:uncharacterized protein MONOS_17776 [Monocercomonoides exilis]|uniref:uncharacterized protein n=1 Tax=Monocercomonoides exilis TaxID=2049356 RepID=UPI00355AB71B|nr:hypothetical protein MONOS_17776 [Monocercomonoides exilis]
MLLKLESCPYDERKQTITKMCRMVSNMDKEELKLVIENNIFNTIENMVENKKIALECLFPLLKEIEYWKEMKNIWSLHFEESLLCQRFEKMIVDEIEKKDGKNEKFLINLCERYLLLNDVFSSDLASISIPYLFAVASSKEENEEIQREVEIVLLIMCNLIDADGIEKDLFSNGLADLVKYHKQHHNLTHVSYESAWMILICLSSYKKVHLNEMDFVKEAIRELEELLKSVDWKKQEKDIEMSKNVCTITRWYSSFGRCFFSNETWKEECAELVAFNAKLCKIAKKKSGSISNCCFLLYETMIRLKKVNLECFVKEGVVDSILEEIVQSTLEKELIFYCLNFFSALSKMQISGFDIENYELNIKKTKKELFVKLEEEGYDDMIISFNEPFLKSDYSIYFKKIEDYNVSP